ncbi:MAG: 30S ribosomal protein S6 [Blastopirellula sp.]|nr:MAG: 30S ribosomal protein S6 [Blastopirellula sp.]
MAANVYEGMLILDSNKYARDPSGISSQVDQLIEKLGGEVLVSRLWSEQKLAYPINGQRKGTYWLTYFRIDSLKMTELNYACNINDDLMRFLFIKHDPRIVDMLVSHAGGDEAEEPEAEDADAEVSEVVEEVASSKEAETTEAE